MEWKKKVKEGEGEVYKKISHCVLLQYGLWRFQTGGTKLENFLPKNQHACRKLLNFENWVNI